MNGRPDLERQVRDWLMATAPAQAPRGVLDAALERVADVGQERSLGGPLGGRVGGSGWLRWAIVGAALAAAILGAIAGAGAVLRREDAIIRPPQAVDLTPQAVDLTPQAVDLTPQAVDLAWTLERAAQDWPGPLRAEPADGAPIAFVAPGSDEGAVFRDPRGDTVPAPLAVVDIVEVLIREGCWMSLTTEGCFFYDMASPLAPSQLDPHSGWFAYGIVVDNTGDGRPDLRFGVDNAAANAGGRMWLDRARHRKDKNVRLPRGSTLHGRRPWRGPGRGRQGPHLCSKTGARIPVLWLGVCHRRWPDRGDRLRSGRRLDRVQAAGTGVAVTGCHRRRARRNNTGGRQWPYLQASLHPAAPAEGTRSLPGFTAMPDVHRMTIRGGSPARMPTGAPRRRKPQAARRLVEWPHERELGARTAWAKRHLARPEGIRTPDTRFRRPML